jgi:hypothetical protein
MLSAIFRLHPELFFKETEPRILFDEPLILFMDPLLTWGFSISLFNPLESRLSIL